MLRPTPKPPMSMFLLAVTAIASTLFLGLTLTGPSGRGHTFFFTLGYLCFLELLFFAALGNITLRAEKKTALLGAVYPVLLVVTAGYILFGLGVVLTHSLFLSAVWPARYYYLTIFTGSALAVIIYGWIGLLDVARKSAKDKQTASKKTLTVLAEELVRLDKRYRRVLQEKALPRASGTAETCLSQLAAKVRWSNPRIAGDPDFKASFEKTISDIQNHITHLEHQAGNPAKHLIDNIEQVAAAAVDSLDQINQLARR